MSSRTSHTQFSMLVEFMEKNGDLSKPQNLPNGRLWSSKKWKELSDLLNGEGSGETRSEEKWRKVWSDFKNKTKRKWAKMNKSVQGTGGGPALNLCLTDLEQRVMAIIGVQAAMGMAIPEVGFGMVMKIVETDEKEAVPIHSPPAGTCVDDEHWNIPGSSKDDEPTVPIAHSKSPTPPKSPKAQTDPAPTQQPSRKRKRSPGNLEEYFIRCEMNAREDNRDRERMFVDIEKERIHQRDIELRQRDTEPQLQAQWLELIKGVVNVLDNECERMNDTRLHFLYNMYINR